MNPRVGVFRVGFGVGSRGSGQVNPCRIGGSSTPPAYRTKPTRTLFLRTLANVENCGMMHVEISGVTTSFDLTDTS